MTLYTLNGSYPAPIPERIRLSDGSTRSDSSTFDQDEIQDAGYVEVPNPPVASYPNKLNWNSETLEWEVIPPSTNETDKKRYEIQMLCKQLLEETDYKVIKSIETEEPLTAEMKQYRQELRNIYNGVNEIQDVWNFVLPVKPAD